MSLEPCEFARLTEHCRILGELESCAHSRDDWTIASRWAHVSKRLLLTQVQALDPFEESQCFYAFATALRASSTFRVVTPLGPETAKAFERSVSTTVYDLPPSESKPEPETEPTLVDAPPQRRQGWRRLLYFAKGPIR